MFVCLLFAISFAFLLSGSCAETPPTEPCSAPTHSLFVFPLPFPSLSSRNHHNFRCGGPNGGWARRGAGGCGGRPLCLSVCMCGDIKYLCVRGGRLFSFPFGRVYLCACGCLHYLRPHAHSLFLSVSPLPSLRFCCCPCCRYCRYFDFSTCWCAHLHTTAS